MPRDSVFVRHAARPVTSPIDVTLAVTRTDRDAASRLVHHCYLRRGYAKPSADGRHTSPYLSLPSTAVFVARSGGTVVATISLIADSTRGLPCDALWPSALRRLRRGERRLAEVSALAVSEAWRGSGLRMLRALVQTLGVYARDLARIDTLCVAVHPRHAGFYEALLRFRRFGTLTPCGAVNGAPAVGLSLDLGDLETQQHDAFAASLFRPPRRHITLGRLRHALKPAPTSRLQLLHSCAQRGDGGATKMC